MAILSAVLLASENEKLCLENQRQKRKRAKKCMYIARGGVLLGVEGASHAQAAQKGAVEGARQRLSDRNKYYISVAYANQQNIMHVCALDARLAASK